MKKIISATASPSKPFSKDLGGCQQIICVAHIIIWVSRLLPHTFICPHLFAPVFEFPKWHSPGKVGIPDLSHLYALINEKNGGQGRRGVFNFYPLRYRKTLSAVGPEYAAFLHT